MKKLPIGILDMGIEGIGVLKEFSNLLKHENIIYINDLDNYPYIIKEDDGEEINLFVKNKVEQLLKYNIKILVVVSDCIIEYCSKYLSTLKIPVISIVSSLIEYVNENYELKNMVLLAKQSIIEANLYQKNFKYNHLYNIPADGLVELMDKNMIKTSESFEQVKLSFAKILKRDLEVMICSSPYLTNFKTEFYEFIKVPNIINVGEVLAKKVLKKDIEFYNKGKGKVFIISALKKREFKEKTSWLEVKYKYLNLHNLEAKQKKALL